MPKSVDSNLRDHVAVWLSIIPGGITHNKSILLFMCGWGNSAGETFRSSNDHWKFYDSVNHSASQELMKNPVFSVGPRNTHTHIWECVWMLSDWLWRAAAPLPPLPEWLRSSQRETFFTTLFPLALDNVPVTQWLDAMWEPRGGLLLPPLGSLLALSHVCACTAQPHY